MKSRILLIRPSTVMKGTSFIATQFPLNIASIAASLTEKGHTVKILDFDVETFDEVSFTATLNEVSPSLVGISCYTPTIINGHRIASIVKRVLPGAWVVVGGPHVSAMPKETLEEFRSFDIGVIGEGEKVMQELIETLSAGRKLKDVAGIIYRQDDVLVVTQPASPISDLDAIPFPARNLLNIPLYKGQSHRGFSRDFLKITEIMTSRGCPNRCIFCASDVVMGRGVRFRSAGSVRREIGECVDAYGFNHFTISDDTFTLKEDRLYEICEEFSKRKVTWNCNARVWPISKKMLSVMSGSGCTGITFGVESGSPRILGLIKKNVTVAQIEDAFRLAKEAGIRTVEADVIIGSHPSETKDDIRMTERLLSRIAPDIVMISIIVPYPGTEIYSIMSKSGLLNIDGQWDSFILFGKEPAWRTQEFSSKDMVALQKKMLFDFYFRPSYMLKTLARIRDVRELSYWVRGGVAFLSNYFNK